MSWVRLPDVNHVLIFENKGQVAGESNPHPHCQIYATNFIFKTIATELEAVGRYWREHRRVLFEDIIAAEQADIRRILERYSGYRIECGPSDRSVVADAVNDGALAFLAHRHIDPKRALAERDAAVAFVPYFARYAYETYIAPNRPIRALPSCRPANSSIWPTC